MYREVSEERQRSRAGWRNKERVFNANLSRCMCMMRACARASGVREIHILQSSKTGRSYVCAPPLLPMTWRLTCIWHEEKGNQRRNCWWGHCLFFRNFHCEHWPIGSERAVLQAHVAHCSTPETRNYKKRTMQRNSIVQTAEEMCVCALHIRMRPRHSRREEARERKRKSKRRKRRTQRVMRWTAAQSTRGERVSQSDGGDVLGKETLNLFLFGLLKVSFSLWWTISVCS